jgi:hypothetical protein
VVVQSSVLLLFQHLARQKSVAAEVDALGQFRHRMAGEEIACVQLGPKPVGYDLPGTAGDADPRFSVHGGHRPVF